MKKIKLKTIQVGDVEDPEIYIAEPIYQWQQTEHGSWAMEHGHNLEYHRSIDYKAYGNKYVITGEFTDEDYLYYKLRWGDVTES